MLQKIIKRYRAEGIGGVHRAIRKRLRLLRRPPPIDPVTVALEEILKGERFVIVQIGAYVGNTANDPLFQTMKDALSSRAGRLICVEPVKTYFEQLVENYRGVPNVVCENVAISDRSGEATFFRLGVDPVAHGFPAYLSQLGSLKEDRLGSLWDNYEGDIDSKEFYLRHRVKESVSCITFVELLCRQGVDAIDLLQIDVEGYEFEILSSIDFGLVPVRFVNYESVLLQKRKKQLETRMRNWGYALLDHGQDTFCYGNKDQHLRRRLTQRVRPSSAA